MLQWTIFTGCWLDVLVSSTRLVSTFQAIAGAFPPGIEIPICGLLRKHRTLDEWLQVAWSPMRPGFIGLPRAYFRHVLSPLLTSISPTVNLGLWSNVQPNKVYNNRFAEGLSKTFMMQQTKQIIAYLLIVSPLKDVVLFPSYFTVLAQNLSPPGCRAIAIA